MYKRKRASENDDIDIASQCKSKKNKRTDAIEEPSTSANNEKDDSFDSLIFDGSDVETSIVVTDIIEKNTPDALKISIDTEPKQRKKHNWTETEFESLDSVEEFLESEGFVLYDDKILKIGQKFYFRCQRIPKDRKRADWCAAQYIIFLPSDTNKTILQFNGCEHNHNALLSTYKLRPVSNMMKAYITDLFDSGVTKPAVIRNILSNERNKNQLFIDEPNPTTRQINYQLAKYRQKGSKPVVNMGDLSKWCDERMAFPSDPDNAFVIGFDCSTQENQNFRFCMSTPHLLNLLSTESVISIDATYKLNWMEYPLIILGVVDNMKQFHPMVYACSSHERTEDYTFVFETVKNTIALHFNKKFEPKILVSDAADAIRNGFYNVHEDSAEADVMCFAHVLRNVRKRPFMSKANKALIIDDIRKIQLASKKSTFDLMTRLFVAKWEHIENNFVEYFKKQWLGMLIDNALKKFHSFCFKNSYLNVKNLRCTSKLVRRNIRYCSVNK